MTLWQAALLALVLLAGLLWVIFCKKGSKRTRILIVIALGILLAAAAGYLLLGTLLLMRGPNDLPEPESTAATQPLESTAAAETTTVPETTVPVTAPPTGQTEPDPQPTLPEDYDLPVDQVPEALPDPLNAAGLHYEEEPYFDTAEELAFYLLNRFLNRETDLRFYLSPDLAPAYDEGAATYLVNKAIEAAQAYYLFGAVNTYTLMVTETTEDGWSKLHLDLREEAQAPEYDLEARAEAIEYVLRHPVPEEGFQSAEAEQAYARGIRDYLVQRLSYDPIGYSTETMLSGSSYTDKQEAYNALAGEDKMVVCAGYARGFALIAHYAGIDCAYVTGNESADLNESHAWNVLYPCDGSDPVVIDVTWDDLDLTDIDGTPVVSDQYFYVPLDQDTEHTMRPEIAAFLEFTHAPQL